MSGGAVSWTMAQDYVDLVARLETAVGRSLQHHPRGIAAWNDRQGEVTLTAKADPDIKMIQAAG